MSEFGKRLIGAAKEARAIARGDLLPPLHPGEVLRVEFIKPLGLSAGTVAKAIGVPRVRIERIVDETGSISADTAVLLAKFFATTPEFWMNLQAAYELQTSAKKLEKKIAAIEPVALKAE